MSRKIEKLTPEAFNIILIYTQKVHETQKEPIPVMYPNNKAAVEQCLDAPFSTFDGIFLYKGFKQKAAYLFYNFLKSHPLANGNKRMGCMTLAFFCMVNSYELSISDKDFEKLALRVVKSDPAKYESELKYIYNLLNRYCRREA